MDDVSQKSVHPFYIAIDLSRLRPWSRFLHSSLSSTRFPSPQLSAIHPAPLHVIPDPL